MRWRTWAVAAVLLVMPSAAAAAWDDPAADHEVGYTALSQFDDGSYVWSPGEETGWYPQVDLVGASITEPNAETIRFEVEVASKEPEGSEPHEMEYTRYEFRFTYHGQNRSLLMTHIWELDMAVGSLRAMDGDRWRTDFSATGNATETGWYVDVPKFDFRDARLVPIRAGDVLEDIRVVSETDQSSTYSPCYMRPENPPHCWKARDAIADGVVLGDYEVVKSPPHVGHLELMAAEPLRSSNGLATTYIFELVLFNLGPEDDRALLAVDEVPQDWQINMPLLVDVPGESTVPIPVAVTVPFTHLHGNAHFVNITATSQRDPDVLGKQTIGVVWTETPQPAGHHPVLYLHGADDHSWMNTLAEDPDGETDARDRASGYSAYFGLQDASYSYRFRVNLDPPLQSGLDFDVSRVVKTSLAFEFPVDVEPTILVELVRHNETGVTHRIGSAEVAAPSTNGIEAYEPDLEVAATADRIPYERDTNLRLDITINFTLEGGGFLPGDDENPAPLLLPEESEVHLPLVEFVELPDEALLSSLTKFALSTRTETEKRVNPGDVVAFGFVVKNKGEDADTLDWKLLGSNTAWATVHPASTTVPAGGNSTIAVAIQPPAHAVEGEHAQILLFGQSRDDANAQVFVQMLAQVTTAEDLESEDELAAQLRGEAERSRAQGIPVPGFVTLVALGGALHLIRRRLDP